MTKKLEELLDLPDSKEIIAEAQKVEEKEIKQQKKRAKSDRSIAAETIAEYDKISKALPAVKGLGDLADTELNEVADKAMQAYDDLMDLGMNVESRYSGRIFEVAGGLLKTSLDAKVAKMDKKLKMIELQLKKEKMDRDSSADTESLSGEGFVLTDRNSLLEKLKGLDIDKDKDK